VCGVIDEIHPPGPDPGGFCAPGRTNPLCRMVNNYCENFVISHELGHHLALQHSGTDPGDTDFGGSSSIPSSVSALIVWPFFNAAMFVMTCIDGAPALPPSPAQTL